MVFGACWSGASTKQNIIGLRSQNFPRIWDQVKDMVDGKMTGQFRLLTSAQAIWEEHVVGANFQIIRGILLLYIILR